MKLTRIAAYWFDAVFGAIRPRPYWTVTWPTHPDGARTIPVRRAVSAQDAAHQASTAYAPTDPGYTIAYHCKPEVWQVKPGPARRVAGPDYSSRQTT